MVVGSVLNGDCYLTTQYLNQLILSIPSTGVTEPGVCTGDASQSQDRKKVFSLETTSI